MTTNYLMDDDEHCRQFHFMMLHSSHSFSQLVNSVGSCTKFKDDIGVWIWRAWTILD